MGVRQTVEQCVAEAQAVYVDENGPRSLRHIPHEAESLWSKVDHLLYLPILGLTRPRDLYYDLLSTDQKCTKITGVKVYHFMLNAP